MLNENFSLCWSEADTWQIKWQTCLTIYWNVEPVHHGGHSLQLKQMPIWSSCNMKSIQVYMWTSSFQFSMHDSNYGRKLCTQQPQYWKGSDIRVQTYVPNSLHHAHPTMNQMGHVHTNHHIHKIMAAKVLSLASIFYQSPGIITIKEAEMQAHLCIILHPTWQDGPLTLWA
jgi:hypothetical protein